MGQVNWSFWGLRDPVSSATHAFAFLWSIFAALILIRLCRGDRRKQVALAVFGISLVFLYAASALYHAVRVPPDQLIYFLNLDHSAIYLLIAGTHTPVFAVLLRGGLRWRLLAVMWGMAVGGVACEWLLPRPPYWLTVGLFIGMGWTGLSAIVPLLRAVRVRDFLWVFYGGMAYTSGAVLDLLHWPIVVPHLVGPHELFHCLVMVGTFCHFVFMMRSVVTFRSGPATAVVA